MKFDLSRHAIISKIESGEYFQEARDWYALKYISIKTQHFHWAIMLVVSLFSACIAINTSILDHVTKEYPFPLYFNDSIGHFPQIHPLSVGGDDINTSVARYLIDYYINMREGYNPLKIDVDSWNKRVSKVQSLSSRRVFNQYQEWVQPSLNPDSPIIRYKNTTERVVSIDEVQFLPGEGAPSGAKVFLSVVEKSKDYVLDSKWVVDMRFSMADIESVVDDPSNMQFVVTYYQAQLLSTPAAGAM